MIATNPFTRGPNVPNKKKFTKKKALQATWNDSDEDDLEGYEVQEEIANMCFMAIEDEVNTNNNDSYNDLSTSNDEILEEFEKLVSKYSILNNKHSLLKKVSRNFL
ncbi:CCHC-type domain-containing protein [Abeliophyllum distichum]|uniref:CCHC-type domain-containing protein n=1 Tax=Abeliophyllum distichum TaxID=126358 RepID=A0ABD1RD51_9LAMI